MAFSVFGLRPIQLLLIVLVVANVAMLAWHWLEPADVDHARSSVAGPGPEESSGPAPAEPVAQVMLLSERQMEAPESARPEADVEGASEPHTAPAELAPVGAAAAAAVGPDTAEVAATESVQGASAGASAEALVCRAWGPFNDAAEAERLVADLNLGATAYRVVDEETGAATEYLVYIDHGGDREAALGVLEELRSREVEGYIMRGRFNDGVSVGVFSQQDRAARQQERVAAMGYAARLEVLQRTRRVYYLAAQVPPSSIDRGGPNKPCSDIAPTRDIL